MLLPQGVVCFTLPQGVVCFTLPQGVVCFTLPQGVVCFMLPQGVVCFMLPQGVVCFMLPQGVVCHQNPRSWKLLQIGQFPNPSQTSPFLGLHKFFRRFIRGYSSISLLLELTGKNAVFSRNTEYQEAFEKLRNALLTAPVLQIADTCRPFREVSDAGDKAVSKVTSRVTTE